MFEALLVLAIALLASIWTTFLVARMLNEGHRNLEERWVAERDRLLERIQRPERVPAVEYQPLTLPEAEPNEWAQVGQVLDISDSFGLTDDG